MLCCEPTMHTRTAIVVVEQLLPGAKFEISKLKSLSESGPLSQPATATAVTDGLWMIKCKGIGLKASD
jgi:hypothetical protein